MEKIFVHMTVEDGIAVVTIDNPSALNALNSPTLDQLEKIIDEVEKNHEVRGVIITGAGEKSFVAGADISEFLPLDQANVGQFMARGQNIFNRIERLKKPVIAAINGFALGGGNELAMACDIRIASENAVFGQPEVNLGIIPGYGGTQRLPRIVGAGKAKEIIFADERISAQEALRIGLVQRVVARGQALDEARKLMNKIIGKAPRAVMMAKKAIGEGMDQPMEIGLKIERQCQEICFGTKDKDEGTRAFMEKRPPKFTGK